MKINKDVLKELNDNEKICILSKMLPEEIEIIIKERARGMVDMAEIMIMQKA